jgi:hypothetical protein
MKTIIFLKACTTVLGVKKGGHGPDRVDSGQLVAVQRLKGNQCEICAFQPYSLIYLNN